jgi:hypothetical protein
MWRCRFIITTVRTVSWDAIGINKAQGDPRGSADFAVSKGSS